jgi:pimeloyl-ACP methyl ester carboxylesterase
MKAWEKSGVAYYHNGRTDQDMPMHHQLYRDYVANEERLDILAAERRLSIPHLVCHGTEDTSVPLTAAEQILEAGANTRLFTVASDHVFGRKHPWSEAVLPYPIQVVVKENIEFFREAFAMEI